RVADALVIEADLWEVLERLDGAVHHLRIMHATQLDTREARFPQRVDDRAFPLVVVHWSVVADAGQVLDDPVRLQCLSRRRFHDVRAFADHPSRFGQHRVPVLDVPEHVDRDRGVEGAFGERQMRCIGDENRSTAQLDDRSSRHLRRVVAQPHVEPLVRQHLRDVACPAAEVQQRATCSGSERGKHRGQDARARPARVVVSLRPGVVVDGSHSCGCDLRHATTLRTRLIIPATAMTIESGLKKVAEGREAEMFAWEDGKVLRLLRPGFNPATLDAEIRALELAHRNGLPVPRPGERISIDGREGVVLERIEGTDLLTELGGAPEADVARTLLLLGAGEPATYTPVMRVLTKTGRSLFIWLYVGSYKRARPLDKAEVRRWALPVAVARLSEDIEQERARLLSRI